MNDDDMHEDDIDTGTHVEDSRDYSPDDSDDESLVDKVKNALGVDDEMENEDEQDLDEEPMLDSEIDEEEKL